MKLSDLKDFGFVEDDVGTLAFKVTDNIYFRVYECDDNHGHAVVDFGEYGTRAYKKVWFRCLHHTHFESIENALAYVQWHRTNAIVNALQQSRKYSTFESDYNYWQDLKNKYKEEIRIKRFGK